LKLFLSIADNRRNMNSKIWIRKTLSTGLAIAIFAAYSMVTLAGTEKIAGELFVSGKAVGGQAATVKVNGETAQSGRSIFTASTITTPDETSAIVNLGKAGKIELAPGTTMTVSFDADSISGDLSAGSVTVLSASNSVSVKTLDGKVLNLKAGESAGAQQSQTNNNGGGAGNWLLYAVIIGGAAAGIIFAATTDNNRVALGGGTTIVSTTR
jgi:hypothetical protein